VPPRQCEDWEGGNHFSVQHVIPPLFHRNKEWSKEWNKDGMKLKVPQKVLQSVLEPRPGPGLTLSEFSSVVKPQPFCSTFLRTTLFHFIPSLFHAIKNGIKWNKDGNELGTKSAC
jgi:hypothetical protein